MGIGVINITHTLKLSIKYVFFRRENSLFYLKC